MSHMAGFNDPKMHAEAIRRQLAEYLVKCGGTADLVDDFEIFSQQRNTGIAAGSLDTYFVSPEGKRMRSRLEVARHFGLAPDTAAEAAKAVKQQEQQEQKQEREQKRQARAQEKALEKSLRVPRARRARWLKVAPTLLTAAAPPLARLASLKAHVGHVGMWGGAPPPHRESHALRPRAASR